MEQLHKSEPKPRHEFFFELLDEATLSLNQLISIEIDACGIDAVNSEFNLKNMRPEYGSLRFDKDIKGRIFLQEFRPGNSAIKGGYFYSFNSERPFWEIVGTLLARLNKKRKRHLENIVHTINKSYRSNRQYCLILQGGLNKDFLRSLLEQGRVSYNTHNEYLREEPLYSALSILSELSSDQVIETVIRNEHELKNELIFKLSRQGKSLSEIACVVGKNNEGNYYTSSCKKMNQFPIHEWKDKVIPVNIANEISSLRDSFLKDKGILVLDKLTLAGLKGYLQDQNNFSYKTPAH